MGKGGRKGLREEKKRKEEERRRKIWVRGLRKRKQKN